MKNKVLCVLLVLLTLVYCVLPLYSYANDSWPFDDVPVNGWMYAPVSRVYSLGYMVGTSANTFSPSATMNRAMMVVVMAKVAGADLEGYDSSPFGDVPVDSYYYKAVCWAYANGITAGNEKGEFNPLAPLTREQVIVFLRALGDYLNYDVTYEDQTLLKLYHDNSSISSYARPAVAWALDYGLIAGNQDHALNPKKAATRAEAAAMISGFLDYTETPPVVPPKIFKVDFVNWDGTQLYSDYIAEGGSATYRASAPTRKGNEYYKYVFTGWDKPLTGITSDTRFVAQFEKRDIYYTAKFVNWNGSVLYTTEVKAGVVPEYSGATPKRPNDNVYSYVFKGWDKIPAAIFSNVTYKALYDARPKQMRDIHSDVFGSGLIINGGNGFKMSSSLNNRINNLLYNSGGRTVGFYVVDLGTNMTFSYNANVDFQTASTVKAGMALVAYKRAEQGYFSLDDYWTYQPKHFCERSGTIVNSPYGTKFKAREVLHRMINISDNAAYYMVHDYVGVAAYNSILTGIGYKHTHARYNSWGFLTPQELGFVWYELYYYRNSSSYGKALFNEFLNAQFNFIKQGLNYKYSNIAHKSGWNDNGYHDSAIVFAERPYIMVIMTKPGTFDGNQSYLSRVARLLDEFMGEYTVFMKNR